MVKKPRFGDGQILKYLINNNNNNNMMLILHHLILISLGTNVEIYAIFIAYTQLHIANTCR